MSGNHVRTAAAALLAAALAAAAAGCGIVDGAGPPRVVLPAAFPADVPLPEGAVVRAARDMAKRGLNVVLEVRDGQPGLAAGFAQRMRAAGWTAAGDAALEGAVFMSFRKGERSVAAGVSSAGGVTLLSISVVDRPYNEWGGDA